MKIRAVIRALRSTFESRTIRITISHKQTGRPTTGPHLLISSQTKPKLIKYSQRLRRPTTLKRLFRWLLLLVEQKVV